MKLIERKINSPENEAVILEYYEFTHDFMKIKDFILESGEKLLVYRDDKTLVNINISDILYFEAVKELVFAYTVDGMFEIRSRLYKLEDDLSRYKIMRASKSFLINLYHISEVTPALNGRLIARMDNGEKVMISRRYAKLISEQFMKGLV